MKADGISRMSPRDERNGPCEAVIDGYCGVDFKCGKHARYMTPRGRRCFVHAQADPALAKALPTDLAQEPSV
jgi:hypothetical protein